VVGGAPVRGVVALGRECWLPLLALILFALPLAVLGYGSDEDTARTLDSSAILRDFGRYVPSRLPGYPGYEIVISGLDAVGRWFATNSLSLVAGGAALLLGVQLLRPLGSSVYVWVLATNPVFVYASATTLDYACGLPLGLGGWVLARKNHHVLAGLVLGLATTMRLSNALWFVAIYGAMLLRRRIALSYLARAVLGTAVLVVPAYYLPYHFVGSLSFLHVEQPDWTVVARAGRFGYKNIQLVGVLAAGVALFAVWRSALVSRWRDRPSVSPQFVDLALAAAILVVLEELVFLAAPLEVPYLLPALVGALVLVAVLTRPTPVLIAAFAGAQVIYGLVAVDVLSPNIRYHATRADVGIFVSKGYLLDEFVKRKRLDQDKVRHGYFPDARPDRP
jgi:hypothetical protein